MKKRRQFRNPQEMKEEDVVEASVRKEEVVVKNTEEEVEVAIVGEEVEVTIAVEEVEVLIVAEEAEVLTVIEKVKVLIDEEVENEAKVMIENVEGETEA